MTVKTQIKQLMGIIGQFYLSQFVLPGKCVIFTFHRVLPEKDYANTRFEQSIAVSDSAFEFFLVQLTSNFSIISLDTLIEKKLKTLEGKTPYACITFDDGWSDNYHHAFPILKKLQIPATIFLSTNYIDNPNGFWWQHLGDALSSPHLTKHQQKYISGVLSFIKQDLDWENMPIDSIIQTIKLHYYDKAHDITGEILNILDLPVESHGLNWNQCVEMSKHGISFGSHTQSHPRLSLLSSKALTSELEESKNLLLKRSIKYCDAICYPYGDFDTNTLTESARLYQLGLTTQPGFVKPYENNAMKLRRINVPEMVARKPSQLYYRLLKAHLKGTNADD